MPKTVAKKAKPKKAPKTIPARRKDWRDAIRLHLAKVPQVDAVYVSTASATIHVYSVVESLRDADYKHLIRQEDRIEKEFPAISFEFHATAHQGRRPTGKESHTSELVFLR
jgi:hypothetical protein